jgi:UDPglucose--hexose-1-phosphate uridylyltransferase
MKDAILRGRDFFERESIAKHKAWFEKFKDNYSFTEENTEKILKAEIGRTFVRVLSDAGVYKDTPDGRAAFLRFVDFVNGAKP